MRPGAGTIAPAETKHERPIAAIPSNETHLMMDGLVHFHPNWDETVTFHPKNFHPKPLCRCREEKPMAAAPRPNDTATVV